MKTLTAATSLSLLSAAVLSVAALAGAAGCSGSSPADGNPSPVAGHDQAKSSLARDTAPSLTDAERQSVAEGHLALTADLVGKLRTTPEAKGNFAFSPFSIEVAMSMPYAGAKGATASEIAKTLHWTLPQAGVAKAYDWATLELAQRADQSLASATKKASEGYGPTVEAPSADSFRLHVVNAIWGDRRMTFESPFLDSMARDYGAGVTLADFVASPDAERLAINAWVSDETQQKIQNLLPAGSIDDSTRLVLVNALHLKMPWSEAMVAASTPAPFILADGSKVDVTYVGTNRELEFYEDASSMTVRVPLEGGSVSMMFVIPKGDLATFEASLTAGTFATIRAGLKATPVELQLPKFRFETASIKLKETLQALGMLTPFQVGVADFSGIGHTDGPLFIGDVFHKAMVGLDEKGVEAAAATAVVMNAGSAGPVDPPKQVHANRPFFFAIVDEPTSSVLFAGHVADPTAK
jgi:serpin B